MILTLTIEDFPDKLYHSIWKSHQILVRRNRLPPLNKTNDLDLNYIEMQKLDPHGALQLISQIFAFHSEQQINKSNGT